jgi:hypothetical protein
MLSVSRKKHHELTTHRGYDDNRAHGYVTMNIKHHPGLRMKSKVQERRDSTTSDTFVSIELPPEQEPNIDQPTDVDAAQVTPITK